MFKITIEKTDDDGYIKIIEDDNINGGGKIFEKKEIFLGGENINNSINFLTSLVEDLGIFIGNENNKEQLYFTKKEGKKYNMSKLELFEKQKNIIKELNELKSEISIQDKK